MWLSPAFLALGLGLALLVLLPTRRLYRAGWRTAWLAAYYLTIVLLGLLVAELRVGTRFLVPILIVAYLAPFVTLGDGLARLLGGRSRPGRRPPPKDVTPRGRDRPVR